MLGWELPPHNSGGLGIACYQLCKSLAQKGADIEFILPYTNAHPEVGFMRINSAIPQDVEVVQRAGLAYESFRYVKTTGQIEHINLFGQSAIYEEAVGRIASLGDYDIIHAHDWMTFRAALRAKAITGKPLIAHIHTIESDRAGKAFSGNPLCRDIEATTLLMADRVVAISNHTKQSIIREYGIPADKIAVVHNHFDAALDFNFLDQTESGNAYHYLATMREQGYKVVSSIGRMTIQKGLPGLLQAFRLAHERLPKTLLLMAGAGEQRNELVQLAADLGIGDSVVFAGFQRGKRYGDAFKVADLFVLPSVSEPFGVSALEAVAYGAPLLVSKQAGVREVLRNCLSVDHWDINEMANKMVAVLSNKELAEELTNNASREYNSHSWEQSTDVLWEVYDHHAGKVAA